METEYHDEAFPGYVVTRVKEDASGNSVDKYVYFDGLGRTIQSITFGEDNNSIVTKTHYDEMGRKYLVEGPFFSTGAGYPKSPPTEYPWVQTEYDNRGRPKKVTRPDDEYGTVATTFSYDGLSTTVTDPDNKQKTNDTISLLLTLARPIGHPVHTFLKVPIRKHLLFHSFYDAAYRAILFHLKLAAYLRKAVTS